MHRFSRQESSTIHQAPIRVPHEVDRRSSEEGLEPSRPPSPAQTRRRVFGLLATAALLAFALWVVALGVRSHEIRRDLESHLAWLQEVRRLEREIEPWRGPGPGIDPPPEGELLAASISTPGETSELTDPSRTIEDPGNPPDQAAGSLDEPRSEAPQRSASTEPPEASRAPTLGAPLERALAELETFEQDPALQFAVRDLRRSLEELIASGGGRGSWDARQRTLSAATSLEARLQHQVSSQLRQLDRHWRRFDVLVGASLGLIGLTLLLLHRGQQRRTELDEALAEAARRASHDHLTGLWNREAILKLLRDELARAARNQAPVGVVLIDLDHFKQINVLLGEEQGDFILEQLAGRLGDLVRPYDILGRLGGDAFLVVLPACDAIATSNVARRLREAVNEHDVEHALGRVRVTLSLAFTTVHSPDGLDAALLAHRLGEALSASRQDDPQVSSNLGRLIAVDEDPAAA